MKKLSLLLMAAGIATASMAQTPVTHEKKKEEMHSLKKEVVEKKQENKDMGKDLSHVKIKAAVAERKEKRAIKRDIDKKEDHLEAQGVKHPVKKVKHEIKAEKEEKKAKY